MTSFQWMRLGQAMRNELVKIFAIKRSQGSTVHMLGETAKVVSDGYTDEDLAVITVAKMQAFLKEKKETDFWKLMDATIDKIENPVNN